ncbi:hypothetical protein ACHAWT_004359 [Skeletonema menzelii]
MTKHVSYILLGDGDFTYSLDMCRYLAALSNHHSLPTSGDDNKPAISSSNMTQHHDVTCTGVDTSKEVKSKYKDADFILTNILSINKRGANIEEQQSSKSRITTKIVHGVNAVNPIQDEKHPSLQHFDHVLFHHPHLGIEDAQLHKRFLLHFFHAAASRWMKPNGGLLYLTLVKGQCERWVCISGAERHGLVLLRRSNFCPPPPPPPSLSLGKEKAYYQLRRHQSGKSFANRRVMQGGETTRDGESETLVFGRSCDYPLTSSSVDDNVGMLPWEENAGTASCKFTEEEEAKSSNNGDDVCSSSIPADPYPCNYCTKSFVEERSLKNHIICSHPECDEAIAWAKKKRKKGKKRKMEGKECLPDEQQQQQRSNEGVRLVCKICDSQKKEDEPTRVFPHKQALLDHERAKHSGVHLEIKPDWYKGGEESCDEVNEKNGNVAPSSVSSCPICGLIFSSDTDRIRHEQDFVPTASTDHSPDGNGASQSSFQCSYCSKSFREERAKRQHENFCSSAAASLT